MGRRLLAFEARAALELVRQACDGADEGDIPPLLLARQRVEKGQVREPGGPAGTQQGGGQDDGGTGTRPRQDPECIAQQDISVSQYGSGQP